MSDTPRTGKQEQEGNSWYYTGDGADPGCVPINFARQLERELADANRRIGELEKIRAMLDGRVETLTSRFHQKRLDNEELAASVAELRSALKEIGCTDEYCPNNVCEGVRANKLLCTRCEALARLAQPEIERHEPRDV